MPSASHDDGFSASRAVSENPGYALLGGPMLAVLFYAVGTYLFATGFGLALAFVVYVLGWALVLRSSDEEEGGSPESDDDGRTRRERGLEVETGGDGGNGGGG